MCTRKGWRVILFFALALVLALAGCASEPQAVVIAPSLTMAPTIQIPTTGVAPTATPRPTETVTPSGTPAETPSATRTGTPAQTATHTETPTPTLAPSVTPTPPPVTLQGRLFFDKNGSGLRDREDENGLVGYTVCALGACVVTGEDGTFVLELPGDSGATVHLTFDDPNKGNPALEMRYINEWKGPVVIPAYTMNGVDVPEQHLNDTDIMRLDDGMYVPANTVGEIGLMQGLLTSPFACADADKISWVSHFDHDSRPGHIINYLGETQPWRDDNPGLGTWDGHAGTDYGVPVGTFIVASLPGVMTHEFVNPDNGARVGRIEYRDVADDSHFFPLEVFAHHCAVLIKDVPDRVRWEGAPRVYRGQIVALSGMTGHFIPHLHFSYATHPLPTYAGEMKDVGAYGVQFQTEDYAERISAWTIYNTPVCYP